MGLVGATKFFESGSGRRVLKTATSPILEAGQTVISGMRLTTGVGDPEAGDRFGAGADLMSDAGKTLQTAFPGDSWDSVSANSYSARNTDQLGRTATVVGADQLVADVLARESAQISTTRENLDAQSDWLADMSVVTMATGSIPHVGQAAKMAAEIAIVTEAVGVSTTELMTMQQNADANAAEVETAVQQYFAAGSTTKSDAGAAPGPATDEDVSDEVHDDEDDTANTDETYPDGPEDETEDPAAAPAAAAMPVAGGGGTGGAHGGGAQTSRSPQASATMPTPASSSTPGVQPAAATPAGADLAGVMSGLIGAIRTAGRNPRRRHPGRGRGRAGGDASGDRGGTGGHPGLRARPDPAGARPGGR